MTEILNEIRQRANEIDQAGAWPAEDLASLASAGVMRAAIPSEFGGDDWTALDIHLRYEQIAAASLTLALILSQRDSACSLIDGASDFPMRQDMLRDLARNAWFATVGIAQLTTSRQRGGPALVARRDGDGYRLNGLIPWSTGAAFSRYVIAGAIVESDGRQVLFALPRELDGVRVEPPMELVALRATHTSAVICEDVALDAKFILKGPADQVLSNRRRNLSIGQSFLAMGLCRAALELIGQIDSPAARDSGCEFEAQLSAVREEVINFSAAASTDAPLAAQLRGRCNDLSVRVTHAAVVLHKGSALLVGHPAQRLARESMFLLVWSCPSPVVDCTTQLLSVNPDP